MTAHTIFVVDDHPITRKGVRMLLEDEADLRVCGEARTLAEARQQIPLLQPKLILVDLSLPDGNGLDLIQQFHGESRELRFLVYSVHEESLFAERILRAGGQGFVCKTAPTHLLLQALRQVLTGNIYLSEATTERLLQRTGHQGNGILPAPEEYLSRRERTVFDLIGHGWTTRAIADKLGISIKTVETYRDNIKDKLRFDSGQELRHHAIQWVLGQQKQPQ